MAFSIERFVGSLRTTLIHYEELASASTRLPAINKCIFQDIRDKDGNLLVLSLELYLYDKGTLKLFKGIMEELFNKYYTFVIIRNDGWSNINKRMYLEVDIYVKNIDGVYQ